MRAQLSSKSINIIEEKLRDKLTLKYDNIKGYSLHSVQLIKQGSLLFEEEALANVLFIDNITRRCNNCFKLNSDPYNLKGLFSGENINSIQLKQCSNCKKVKYCSKECQLEDWKKAHNKECKKIKGKDKLLEASILLLNRLLQLDEDKKGQFYELIYHDLNTKDKQEYGKLSLMSSSFIDIKKEFSNPIEILETWSRIKFNCLTINDEEQVNLGLGCYFIASLINHSCINNTTVGFMGTRLVLKALKDIQPEEEITISYLEPGLPYSIRKSRLLDNFYFECKCNLCLEDQKRKDIDPLELIFCSNCSKENILNEKCSKGIEICCKRCGMELKPNSDKLVELKKTLNNVKRLITKEQKKQIEKEIICLGEEHYLKQMLYQHLIFYYLEQLTSLMTIEGSSEKIEYIENEKQFIENLKKYLKIFNNKYHSVKSSLLAMLAKYQSYQCLDTSLKPKETEIGKVLESCNLALNNLKITHHSDSDIIKLLVIYQSQLRY
ncbi:SET domain-containing protein [Neoconidiobolus thromboides FSU 785]|nr:SET domain-containing protein [Neoconidiobolus thromboides FSU 785]